MRKATEARTSDRMVEAMGTVSLSVIENLKGDGENRISRTNVWPHKSQHDFDRHRDPGFWDDEHSGLVAFDAACRPETAYATGKTYLLFEGPPHVKMSELIVSDDDAWLAYVRERLAK